MDLAKAYLLLLKPYSPCFFESQLFLRKPTLYQHSSNSSETIDVFHKDRSKKAFRIITKLFNEQIVKR